MGEEKKAELKRIIYLRQETKAKSAYICLYVSDTYVSDTYVSDTYAYDKADGKMSRRPVRWAVEFCVLILIVNLTRVAIYAL